MSALPHRRHGGDQLHCAVHGLPAGSGYIMILARCSDRAKVKCPPERDWDVRAANGSDAAAERPGTTIQSAPIVREGAGTGTQPPTAVHRIPVTHGQW